MMNMETKDGCGMQNHVLPNDSSEYAQFGHQVDQCRWK